MWEFFDTGISQIEACMQNVESLHPLPSKQLIASHGGLVLDCLPDSYGGPLWDRLQYLVTRA